jgi:Ca2+-binding EF-hand superfamily protein
MRIAFTVMLLTWATGIAAADDQRADRRKPGQKQPDAGRAFTLFDRNKDGALDRSEIPPRLRDQFDKVDRNHDGKVTRDEWQRVGDRAKKLSAAAKRKMGRAAKARGMGEQELRSGPASLRFDDLDKNADGRLSRDELRGSAVQRHFDEIDTNQDGKIDPKELDSFNKKNPRP